MVLIIDCLKHVKIGAPVYSVLTVMISSIIKTTIPRSSLIGVSYLMGTSMDLV
jgi:hypothetical protein